MPWISWSLADLTQEHCRHNLLARATVAGIAKLMMPGVHCWPYIFAAVLCRVTPLLYKRTLGPLLWQVYNIRHTQACLQSQHHCRAMYAYLPMTQHHHGHVKMIMDMFYKQTYPGS